jgi:hypothetical protein
MKTMKNCFLFPLLAMLLANCKDKDMIIKQDDIVKIEFQTDTSNLFADNNSILEFKGVIPANSKETFRNITFAVTDGIGEFLGTVKDKRNIVLADQSGFARSAIKIGTKPGNYFLSAEVTADGKTYKSKDYRIRVKPQAQNDLIKLEFESNVTNLRADNQSIINLKATIPPYNTGEIRTVTFIASQGAGQFKGTGATVVADESGIARANLEVSGSPGDYFLAAEVKIGDRTYRTADIPVRLNPVPANEKISLTVDNIFPAADGFSLVHISVNTKFTKDKTVVLAANAGTFIQSSNPQTITLALNQQGAAETDLRISSEAKPHIISAMITETPPATITVSPVISYPEVLFVEASALKIEAEGPAITLRTFLRKLLPERMVTKSVFVDFRAYQVVNNMEVEVGRFNGLSTSTSGIDGAVPAVSFFADSPGIDKNVPIVIEVSAPKNPTEKIIKRIMLVVQ